MRSIKYLASFAAFAIMFTLCAFAKDSNSASFDLTQTAQLGTTVLHAGHYKSEWSGTNPVEVSIIEHGKTVATAQGQLKELPAKSPYNAVGVVPGNGPNQQIKEIDFDNRAESLVFWGCNFQLKHKRRRAEFGLPPPVLLGSYFTTRLTILPGT